MNHPNTHEFRSRGRTATQTAMILAGLILLAALVHLNAPPRTTNEEPPQSPPGETPKNVVAKTIRLTLHPAPEPRPALKYLLLPSRRDLETGNAAVLYRQLFEALPVLEEDKETLIDTASDKPLSDLDREELLSWWQSDRMDRLMIRAARQSYCDWQLSTDEGLDLVIPSLRRTLDVAQMIAIYARVLIAEGRFDEALPILQTGVAMSRHAGQDLTLIQGLVGIAIQSLMLSRIEDWVGQPGAPNLYWALSHLPNPMIGLHLAAQGDAVWLERTIPKHQLEGLRTRAMPVEESRSIGGGLLAHANKEPGLTKKIGIEKFSQVTEDLRDRVVRLGYPADLVRQMPAEQIHLLYTIDRYRELMDEQTKWYALPFADARSRLAASGAAVTAEVNSHPLLGVFVGDIGRALLLAARTDRQVAVLRTIEAIRIYAAEHDGKLPGALADITTVPVPGNPVSGKPFGYELNGETAILDATEGDDELQLRYELTIAPPS